MDHPVSDFDESGYVSKGSFMMKRTIDDIIERKQGIQFLAYDFAFLCVVSRIFPICVKIIEPSQDLSAPSKLAERAPIPFLRRSLALVCRQGVRESKKHVRPAALDSTR